jgi:hypothetical protein
MYVHCVLSKALVAAGFTDVVFYLLVNSLDVGLQVVGQSKTLFAMSTFVRPDL